MNPRIPDDIRGQLIAQADHVADELADKWGRARVGAPEYDGATWSCVVRGLCDDAEMRGFRVWPSGAREEVS